MVLIHYDLNMVIYSFIVAIFFCYLSALLADQFLFNNHQQKKNKIFILLSGLFLGLAVWVTFFLSISAIQIPGNYHFDYALILVAFLITFIASAFAVWSTTQYTLTSIRLIFGSILMGLGISGMYYIGLMGLFIEHYAMVYQPQLMVLATLVAILGAGFSFGLAIQYKNKSKNQKKTQLIFSIMMALNIIGMHYIGMHSVSFYRDLNYKYNFVLSTNHNFILFTVILISILIFLVSGIIAFLEQRLEERNRQLSKANTDLAHQAIHDSLTKLPNRLYLSEYAQKLFTSSQQSAFLFIDLDRFKAINDVFGHHIGDRLLIQLVNRIHKYLNKNEQLFRLGGDQFLLVIEHAMPELAMKKAEHLQQIILERFLIEGKEITISASIGIAFLNEHGKDLQELVMNADLAMLNAKEQGRNTYTVFNYSDALLQSQLQTKLINDLYKAVEEDQFILFYQPKFTTKSHCICGVEALIRWQHVSHGLLTPNMFLKGAESTGVIIQMGYWVLEEAIKQIQKWELSHTNLFPVAVNLSVVQFEHKELFITLEQLFEKYKIDPSHLTIEITESTAMQNIEMSILRFERLHQMGLNLAVDDFGTGYSSLLYLKDLAIDELKIDRAFIHDIENNKKSEIILESIINLATRLGLTVTVEGVETLMQADKLTQLGCQQLQGFLFGKPMPVKEIEQWKNDHDCIEN
ncbi:diguanylate cyclase [Acinetobacter sp. ANC 4558]|uniref:bifunctional diguanylate cyclase/phosphodiesterase n=1 Tax=Acinetobacter sp. ANC 4558 TaxID=1977876 RepID=UPI000A348562|nr:EAL domain-containing protein [Acinetobacter sp. ANC 4558]OTG86588.1 diguanylate cyclase [Acinetobacter sp. ANC 4558]